MSRVLIHTMNYWPEPTGFGPLTTDLSDYLVQRGWDVTVLTGFPMAPRWEVYEGYRGRIIQREWRGRVDIRRVWVYVPRRAQNGLMNTWKRVAFDTTFATSSLPVALTLPRHDAIVAVCPPLQTGLAALVLKWLWKSPVLQWLQDIVPDAAMDSGMMREGVALRAGRKLEKVVYRGVDKIGIISPGFQANLEAKQVSPEKMIQLPNWANLARFDTDADGSKSRRRYGFSDRDFVIAHAGSMAAKQYIENVIWAMDLLRDRVDIHLMLIGEGNRLDAIKNEAIRLDLPHVHFIPTVHDSEYVDLLRAADVLLVNQARAVKDAVIPSKLLTYLPSRRPVIAAVHPDSETAHFVKQAGCGLVVEPESPEKLAEAIVYLQNVPRLRSELGVAGAQFIRQNFDRPVLLQRFESVLARMIETGHATTR